MRTSSAPLVTRKDIRPAMLGMVGHANAISRDTFYAFEAQLEAFVQYLRTGIRPFPFSETAELMKIIIAGIRSRNEHAYEIMLSEISGKG